MTTKTITVVGKNAGARVLSALATAFPNAKVETPKEQNIMPTSHAEMIEALGLELTKLERELDHEIALRKKIKRSDTVEDRWSAVGTDGFDDAGDDDGDDDAGDDDDDIDDEDDELLVSKNISNSSYKFEALAAHLAATRGLSKADAWAAARKEFPDAFRGYQAIQQDVSKAAGNYDSLLQAEMRKGVSSKTCAMQRLATQGIAPRADDRGVVEFMSKVDQHMQATGVSRTQAMTEIRKRHPAAFRKFQEV